MMQAADDRLGRGEPEHDRLGRHGHGRMADRRLPAFAQRQIGHGLTGDRGEQLAAGVQPFGHAAGDGGPGARQIGGCFGVRHATGPAADYKVTPISAINSFMSSHTSRLAAGLRSK